MISGLIYLPNYISSKEETDILNKIDAGEWELSLQRRVQQFGPMYNYSTRKLNIQKKPIPEWIK